jgi:hypothetical protein
MPVCFITTCSRNKISGGEDYKSWKDAGFVSRRFVEARKSLFERLRQRQSCLVKGTDFAGTDSGSYLPAWLRYARGAFMGSLQEGLRKHWFASATQGIHEENAIDRWLKDFPLFFISGLYGLVPAREPIQDYDVRLEGEEEFYWNKNAELIAQELSAQMEGTKPASILVLDCCGSFNYSKLINWNYLIGRGIKVKHAFSPNLENSQVRAEAGRLAAHLKKEAGFESLISIESSIKFIDTADFLKHSEQRKTLKQLPLVGVACLTGEQKKKFEEYAEKQRWTDHFIFEFAVNRTIPDDWLGRGIRQLICHTDNKHHVVRSIYGDLSKFPEVIKMNFSEYSSLELKLHYRS